MSYSWKRDVHDYLRRLRRSSDVVASPAVKASSRDLSRRIEKFRRAPRNRDRRGVKSEVNARIRKTLKHLRNALGHARRHDDPEIRREARELIKEALKRKFSLTATRAERFFGLLQKSGHRRAEYDRKIAAYDRITGSIIAAIEVGAGSWQMPWHRGGNGLNRPVSTPNNRRYKGINRISLWVAAQDRGFSSGIWAPATPGKIRAVWFARTSGPALSLRLCRRVPARR